MEKQSHRKGEKMKKEKELKTLKDLEIHHQVEPVNEKQIKVNGTLFGRWNSIIIQPMDLKAEAIKWVKEMSDEDDITPWMEFFNLTEEDLK